MYSMNYKNKIDNDNSNLDNNTPVVTTIAGKKTDTVVVQPMKSGDDENNTEDSTASVKAPATDTSISNTYNNTDKNNSNSNCIDKKNSINNNTKLHSRPPSEKVKLKSPSAEEHYIKSDRLHVYHGRATHYYRDEPKQELLLAIKVKN